MEGLFEFLQKKGLYIDRTVSEILEKKLQTKRKAFLLRGPAGTGKTTLASLIAEYLSAEAVFYQCSYGTSEDDLLYKYIPSETSRSGLKISLGPIPLALKKSQSKPTVLIIDEFDKTRPSADALLLDVLQNFRISLYLDDKETIIQGNPDNLVVFLTSNDMREFSEPLLRRLAIIELKPLPTSEVLKLMRAKFDDKIAILLAQIYDDTIKAGLRKPATIQELYELGELLESGVNTNIEDLLKMFIIKYADDWVKFKYYIARREPYQFLKTLSSNSSNNSDSSLETAYIAKEQIEVKDENEKKEEEKKEGNTKKIVESLSKIIVKKVEREIKKEELNEVKDAIETTAKIVDSNFEQYTKIIKELKIEPSDSPDVLGKFRVVLDEGKMTIISNEPLSLEEIRKIVKEGLSGEYYFEHKAPTVKTVLLNEIISRAKRIKYYTDKTIYMEYYSDEGGIQLKLLIELQNVNKDVFEATFKGYIKYNAEDSSAKFLIETLEKIHDLNYEYEKYIEKLADRILRAIKNGDEEALKKLQNDVIGLYEHGLLLEKSAWEYVNDAEKAYEIAKNVLTSDIFNIELTTNSYSNYIRVNIKKDGVVIVIEKMEEKKQ